MYTKSIRLRPYQDSDDEEITAMLMAEDGQPETMRHREAETYVLENGAMLGFFSLGISRGLPFLVHFCIKKERRSLKNARLLAKAFKETVFKKGFPVAYVFVTKNKLYLKRLIEYYFKRKPYAEQDNKFWYIVGVLP